MKIKSIKLVSTKKRVINLTVKKNHTFITKNGIVTHNCDGLTNIAQGALRGCIEEFPETRFIMTCNSKNKIIDPIVGRFSNVEFTVSNSEKKELMGKFLKKIFEILTIENIKFDKLVVAELVKKNYPDHRKILNDIQKYSIGGVIDSGILLTSANIDDLIGALKDKDIDKARQWLVDSSGLDTFTFITQLYEGLYPIVTADSLACIPLMAEYQFKATMVPNHELNNLAMIYELMGVLEFKK